MRQVSPRQQWRTWRPLANLALEPLLLLLPLLFVIPGGHLLSFMPPKQRERMGGLTTTDGRTLSNVATPQQLTLPQRPLLIGIAGCSGSGKTTLARELATQLEATLFPLDLYSRDLSESPLDSRHKQNFDHPDSLES